MFLNVFSSELGCYIALMSCRIDALSMATPVSSLPTTSNEVVSKVDESNSTDIEAVVTSGTVTGGGLQQPANTRMVPLLYIQGHTTAMRMGTSNVTTSSGNVANVAAPQKVPTAVRSGSALVAAGTQFIPTLAPKLGVTPVISTTSSLTNASSKPSSNVSSGPTQQHFVIQAPRNSVSGSAGTPTIVPVPGKSTIAYLGTFIKPGVGKAGEGQIVLPAGQIMQNSNQKLVLANVPLPLPQLTTSVSPGTNTSGSQQQASAKVTSLLVPMTIPTQVGSSKGGMINLKIANGQIHAEGGGKSSVTFVREKSLSSSTSGQLPPLQPIAKLAPKPMCKTNGILLTDATLAPLNPVILSKHKKLFADNDSEADNTKSNKADDKKKKNQDLNKCLQEAVDAFGNDSPSSPKKDEFSESRYLTEEDKNDDKPVRESKEEKIIKETSEAKNWLACKNDNNTSDSKDNLNFKISGAIDDSDVPNVDSKEDDEITLIKVLPSSTEDRKLEIPDDDVKIELVKPDTKSSDTNEPCSDDFDPMNALEWKDGIGTLPGSALKFRMNEFGMMEMVDDESDKKSADCESVEDVKDDDNCEVVSLEGDPSIESEEVQKYEKSEDIKREKITEEKPIHKPGTSDDIYYCEGCGCYGLSSEFINTRFCSSNCISTFTRKKAAQTKRERELLQLRLRRRKKRLIQLLQLQKAQQEKEKDSKKEKKVEKVVSSPPPPPPPPPLTPPPPSEPPTPPSAPIEACSTPPCNERDEENSSSDSCQTRLPWQMGKSGFSWPKYLEHCKAKAAPIKLFKDPFPYTKNGFRVGMKLEGVDPEHPSYFCVLTVSDIQGYRIRLHFDGYSESHDFWVNADSMDVFPSGWCEKNNHILHPPRGISSSNFNWATYLKQSKAQAAPRHLFMNKTGSAVCPHGFRLGMKLEAVDRKNSSLVCVASVSDLMDNRILVHFDSWDDIYDYWADPSSPFIHPVGWCEEHGHILTPPNNYKGQPFGWETYLKETKSAAAPARAFKQRPPCGFRRGMKLECVDRWVPMLIRVCSVVDVVGHQVKVHFDGWPEQYSYWLDDTNPDIHPMGWCQKTGHPLEPPLTWDESSNNGECLTPGCRGLGNARGPKFMTHNTIANCPYALPNLTKDNLIPDRLFEKGEITESREPVIAKDHLKIESEEMPVKEIKPPEKRPVGRPPKKPRIVETTEVSKAEAQDPDWRIDDDENYEKRRKKRRNLSGERSISPSSTQVSNNSVTPPTIPSGPDLEMLQQELHQSIIQPGYDPNPNNLTPYLWAKHSQYLNSFVVQHKGADASQWSQDDVVQFVTSIPGCETKASVFSEQQIDGEALLMMAQEDLVNVIGMKLGPAIKLYNSIVLLRQKVIGASS